jgi:hypothetical protein
MKLFVVLSVLLALVLLNPTIANDPTPTAVAAPTPPPSMSIVVCQVAVPADQSISNAVSAPSPVVVCYLAPLASQSTTNSWVSPHVGDRRPA